MTRDPLISVIIPVKNGAFWLNNTLQAITAQTKAKETEIIILHSGSTDNSMAILQQYPVQVIPVAPGTFNHGATRNLAVKHAKGKYLAFTVQDAEPENEFWLQNLLDGFNDEKIAGVCGQQIVPADRDKNPVAWFRPLTAPTKQEYHFDSPADYQNLSPLEKRNVCRWDNVNAIYRKDVLMKVPFRTVEFAEDALWANDVLQKGYGIVYNNAARVKHYHFETPDFIYRRSFIEMYFDYKFFDLKPCQPKNEMMKLLRNIKLLINEKEISWSEKFHWVHYNAVSRRAVNKAANILNEAILSGKRQVEDTYRTVCEQVPQALPPKHAN